MTCVFAVVVNFLCASIIVWARYFILISVNSSLSLVNLIVKTRKSDDFCANHTFAYVFGGIILTFSQLGLVGAKK